MDAVVQFEAETHVGLMREFQEVVVLVAFILRRLTTTHSIERLHRVAPWATRIDNLY